MDVGSYGCVSLSDAATWFGIEFDESTGHAHSALADARVTAKLLKQMMEGGLSREPARTGSPPAMGDGRASSDAPFQQMPRARRPAAEAEGGGEVGTLGCRNRRPFDKTVACEKTTSQWPWE